MATEEAVTDEEPLSVAVARALGWTDIQWTAAQGAWGRHPSGTGGTDKRGYQAIPRYGEDAPDGWAWTGPLVDEYDLELRGRNGTRRVASKLFDPEFAAPFSGGGLYDTIDVEGDSYPEAIARLVVKLAEKGKLVRA